MIFHSDPESIFSKRILELKMSHRYSITVKNDTQQRLTISGY